eukprot:12421246-Karenia_brevis.AAC.1
MAWESVFARALGTEWKSRVASRSWNRDKGEFRTLVYRLFKTGPFEDRYNKRKRMSPSCAVAATTGKKPRIVFKDMMLWARSSTKDIRLEIVGD